MYMYILVIVTTLQFILYEMFFTPVPTVVSLLYTGLVAKQFQPLKEEVKVLLCPNFYQGQAGHLCQGV